MAAVSYRELWYSGKLRELSKRFHTATALAQHLGITIDALVNGMRRLRAADPAVPLLSGLFKRDIRIEVGDDFSGEEQTMPGVPVYPEEGISGEIESVQEQLSHIEEHRLKRKLKEVEAINKHLLDQVASLEDRIGLMTEAFDHRIDPIVPAHRSVGMREGTPVFLVSDLHLEEEVKPEKVSYMNKFNLNIARKRMTRLFEGMRWFMETQRQSFDIKTACVWLGGDTFTNYLHDDNIESNLLAPPAAFAFAKQLIGDGLRFLLEDDQIERLVIPCNDGNHGRMSKELRAATRAEMSLETLMYGMLADEFRHEKRVQFEIAQGDHLYTQIHNLTFRWTHLAEVRGGAGIGGVMIPIYRAMARWESMKHAEVTCGGHFHQRISLRDLEVNGSLIGYSPYALRIGARYEEPTQSAFMVDSKRGKSVSAPLWVSDPNDENED